MFNKNETSSLEQAGANIQHELKNEQVFEAELNEISNEVEQLALDDGIKGLELLEKQGKSLLAKKH